MPVGLLIGLEGIRHDSLPPEVLDAAAEKKTILRELRDVPTAGTWSAPDDKAELGFRHRLRLNRFGTIKPIDLHCDMKLPGNEMSRDNRSRALLVP
ncbi:hypothetical protein EYF80_040322 [Liparis tanakae]|uniref:Uncharacterized protein n=1 Tax=Liparis tanakae TaxID=230148 RepID=A0A4Z2G8A8_9TELE|nr:hypothetical protein EYF80_040322 [Liparis tanakae]